jgi:hypothetical protein
MGDIQAMGAVAKVPLSEGAEVIPLAVKHHDRVLTSGENIDIIPRINGNAGTFMKSDALGRHAPAVDILIAKVSDSVYFTHGAPPFAVGMASTRPRRTGHQLFYNSASSSALASCKSLVSKPSVNQV